MNTSPWIVLGIEISASAIPQWDQLPLERQHDLIQALAALLLHLPQLQALEKEMSDERQQ